jgi:undecaprenyl-diphosphatase
MQNFLFNFFVLISTIGGETVMVTCSIIVSLIILYYHKEEKLAGFLFFNYMATMSIVIILKDLIQKPRNPLASVYESSYAFPSGHTAVAMTTVLIVFYLSKFIKNNFWKNFTKICTIIWLLLIIAARLYLKVHDVYDIAGGLIIASFIFYFSLKISIFRKGILKEEFTKVEKTLNKEERFLENEFQKYEK